MIAQINIDRLRQFKHLPKTDTVFRISDYNYADCITVHTPLISATLFIHKMKRVDGANITHKDVECVFDWLRDHISNAGLTI